HHIPLTIDVAAGDLEGRANIEDHTCIDAMNLPIVEVVRRDKTFKRITAFQRDPVGERNASINNEHVVITALCSVLEPIVAKPVLQQNPGRLATQTEAIA